MVEVHGAICRVHRDKEISDLHKKGALARLRLLNRGWREILPDDQIRDLATQRMELFRGKNRNDDETLIVLQREDDFVCSCWARLQTVSHSADC